MPKKVIGREHTQEDLMDIRKRIESDFNVKDIYISIAATRGNWWGVQASCWDYEVTPAREFKTEVTYITERGPHMQTVLWRHLMALYSIVDRGIQGMPPRIGD